MLTLNNSIYLNTHVRCVWQWFSSEDCMKLSHYTRCWACNHHCMNNNCHTHIEHPHTILFCMTHLLLVHTYQMKQSVSFNTSWHSWTIGIMQCLANIEMSSRLAKHVHWACNVGECTYIWNNSKQCGRMPSTLMSIPTSRIPKLLTTQM